MTITPDVFTPKSFTDFIGQKDTKELLSIAVQAAKIEKRQLPNLLFVGPFGVGKTSLAQITHKAAGLEPILHDGGSVNLRLPMRGTIIIDEIHNLDPITCDSLNMRMDSGELSITGCTLDPGKLPAAFRSRFRMFYLQNYTVNELIEIARNICMRKQMISPPNVLKYIAERSRFNARQLIIYLMTIFDIMTVERKYVLDMSATKRAFDMLGVDSEGFLQRDRDYVSALPNRPVGISFLQAVLGIDKDTIENEIEPYLLQKGVIDRTPRGRIKIRSI